MFEYKKQIEYIFGRSENTRNFRFTRAATVFFLEYYVFPCMMFKIVICVGTTRIRVVFSFEKKKKQMKKYRDCVMMTFEVRNSPFCNRRFLK